MKKDNLQELLRSLINKVYNNVDLEDDLLIEINKDLKKIKKFSGEDKFYRELMVLVEAAKSEENMLSRNNFKFSILSDLEKEYRRLSLNFKND